MLLLHGFSAPNAGGRRRELSHDRVWLSLAIGCGYEPSTDKAPAHTNAQSQCARAEDISQSCRPGREPQVRNNYVSFGAHGLRCGGFARLCPVITVPWQ